MKPKSADLRITFIGNEGVVVTDGVSTVALDALFGNGAAKYATTSDELVEQISTAQPPFNSVDLVLATHYHPDHFDPVAVATHLLANTETHYLGTPQSLDLLADSVPNTWEFGDRTHSMWPGSDETATRRFGLGGGIEVSGFRLSHGSVNYGDVEQLGLKVRLGDFSMVHLGDGIIHEKALDRGGVFDENLDVAFVPFWFVTYPVGKRLIANRLRAKRVFAVHIPPAQAVAIVSQIEFKNTIPLLTPMETHTVVG